MNVISCFYWEQIYEICSEARRINLTIPISVEKNTIPSSYAAEVTGTLQSVIIKQQLFFAIADTIDCIMKLMEEIITLKKRISSS